METYYLSDSANELERLAFQHQMWSSESTELWNRAGFGLGDHILDLGCGPGYTTLELSKVVGENGLVTGLDSSKKFIDHLEQKIQSSTINNIDTLHCNINQIKLNENLFDGIYARMVMCFLKEPKDVLQKLSDSLKPGGKIAITDFFSYAKSFVVIPESPAIQKAMNAIEEGNSLTGGNFNVQKTLPLIIDELGLEIIDTKAYMGAAHPQQPLWQWPESYFKNMLPQMLEMNLLTEQEISHFWLDWNERKRNKNTFFVGPTFLDLIVQKPSSI